MTESDEIQTRDMEEGRKLFARPATFMLGVARPFLPLPVPRSIAMVRSLLLSCGLELVDAQRDAGDADLLGTPFFHVHKFRHVHLPRL